MLLAPVRLVNFTGEAGHEFDSINESIEFVASEQFHAATVDGAIITFRRYAPAPQLLQAAIDLRLGQQRSPALIGCGQGARLFRPSKFITHFAYEGFDVRSPTFRTDGAGLCVTAKEASAGGNPSAGGNVFRPSTSTGMTGIVALPSQAQEPRAKVMVEHLHVHQGGQAIVGNVNGGHGRGERSRNGELP